MPGVRSALPHPLVPKMKLRAVITVEIDAGDFVEAAEHQQRLEGLLADLRAAYPHARLAFQERRQRRNATSGGQAASPPKHATGRLSVYAD